MWHDSGAGAKQRSVGVRAARRHTQAPCIEAINGVGSTEAATCTPVVSRCTVVLSINVSLLCASEIPSPRVLAVSPEMSTSLPSSSCHLSLASRVAFSPAVEKGARLFSCATRSGSHTHPFASVMCASMRLCTPLRCVPLCAYVHRLDAGRAAAGLEISVGPTLDTPRGGKRERASRGAGRVCLQVGMRDAARQAPLTRVAPRRSCQALLSNLARAPHRS